MLYFSLIASQTIQKPIARKGFIPNSSISHFTVVTPGLLTQIASIYRIAPSFAINISKLRLVFEYELSSAAYGKVNIQVNDGLYGAIIDATNNSGLLMLMYSF